MLALTLLFLYACLELGEGPFTLSSAEQNDSACVFGANVSSGEVFPLLRTNAQPSTIFHFMITTGLYKDRASSKHILFTSTAKQISEKITEEKDSN